MHKLCGISRDWLANVAGDGVLSVILGVPLSVALLPAVLPNVLLWEHEYRLGRRVVRLVTEQPSTFHRLWLTGDIVRHDDFSGTQTEGKW